jgi:copper transport protein
VTAVPRRRLPLLAGLVAAFVVLLAAPAWGHAELAGSEPADGSTVATAPSVVTLRFTEPATAASTRWSLYGPDSRRVADLDLTAPAADEADTFQVALPSGLAPGTYSVGWDGLVTTEGHAVSGQVRFSIGAATVGVDAGPAGGTSGTSLPAWLEEGTDAAKSLWYVSLSLAVGGLVLLAWSRRTAARPGTAAFVRAARVLVWWGAVALCALTIVRFGLVVATFGDGAFTRAGWRAALDARSGSLGLKSIAVTPAILYAARLARRDRRLSDLVPAAALLTLLGVLEVAAGHSGTGERRASAVLVTSIHLLGMALWLGPLLAVLLVPVAARGAWAAVDPADRRAARLGFLRDFAALGGTALGAVLVTGVVTAHDRTGWRFWDGGYGRTLTLKLLLVAAVVVPLAAYHRSHLARPDAIGERFVDGTRFRRTFRVEVAALVAVVVAAAVLTGQDPTPGGGATAAAVGATGSGASGAAGAADSTGAGTSGAPQQIAESSPVAALTPTQPSDCADPDINRIACYETYFDGIVQGAGGPSTALTELSEAMGTDQFVASQCHQLAHQIGHTAAVLYGGDISAAFRFGDSVCWSGYYHGVVEQTIENMSDADLTAKMSAICPIDPANPYSFDRYNCVHGLGHGVTIRTKADVFAALPFCDALTDPWDRSSCDGGVFMENIIEAQAGNQDVSLKADDPVYPCNAVGEAHKLQCYQMVTSNILWRNGYDYAAAFATCDTVEAGYIGTCYRSMGRDISGGSLLDVPKTVELCDLGGEAHRLDCFLGAAANATLDRRDGVKSTELCDVLPEQYRQPCYAERDQVLATF